MNTGRTVRHMTRPQGAPADAELIGGLQRAAAYPHPVAHLEVIETHISWVLLTGDFAYKIKKPVALGFLDFRDLEQRRFFCEEELRLNRFWAPELYLRVVAITMADGQPRVGGDGPAIEYAVCMHQFDQSCRLDRQLDQGLLLQDDMLDLAAEIAARHRDAKPVGPDEQLLRATERLMQENFQDLAGEIADEQVAALRRWTDESLAALASTLRSRCDHGFYRECHGDLHLGNIVRLAGAIRAFDCIEFSKELRRIDVVADYGFLFMDLCARDRADLGYGFLNRYLEISGDYDGVSVLPLYVVYRSLVRAKVAAVRRRERRSDKNRESDTATLEHYCGFALRWTAPRKPRLVVMTGLSGSGKTWLSERLVTAMPALRVRSDLERKRLFGLDETGRSQSAVGGGIYRQRASEAVYARLFEHARTVLDAGLDAILDAAFLQAGARERALGLAADCGADAVIVQATAPRATLEERLRRRSKAGTDASEADLEVLRYQLGRNEPLTGDQRASAVTVSTDGDVDIGALVRRIRQGARGQGSLPA